jgi:hypothetical protein
MAIAQTMYFKFEQSDSRGNPFLTQTVNWSRDFEEIVISIKSCHPKIKVL